MTDAFIITLERSAPAGAFISCLSLACAKLYTMSQPHLKKGESFAFRLHVQLSYHWLPSHLPATFQL